MNVNHLIIDYYAMTEKFGNLDFGQFIEVWNAADVLAEETPEECREAVLDFVTNVAPKLVDE